jgi:hypothetical protein
MNQDQAFCCLNCTNLPPCNAAAGNCAPCCKDCGDTSNCYSSAYFKDGEFYIDYSATINTSYSQTGDGCPAFYGKSRSSYNASISSKRNEIWSATRSIDTDGIGDDSGTIIIQGSDSCGNPTCVGGGYSLDLSQYYCYIPINLNCSNGETIYPPLEEYCNPTIQCLTKAMPPIVAVNGCNTAPNVLPKNEICSGEECGDFCEENTVETNSSSITINFYSKVKLYNSQGQEVGNIIGATYNPCNATASWSAPGCHFFAP